MNEKEILTLDNGEKYIILKQLCLENKKYLYLLKVDENAESVLVENDNNELIVVDNIEKQISILELMGIDTLGIK